MTETMTYDRLERADVDYTADTFGKWPGVAGISTPGEVFCGRCAADIWDYERPVDIETGDLILPVLSDEEWDCPGAYCGHCGIDLDVRVIHYDGVCEPGSCPEW